ncbi:hypothetical protein ABEB36_010724 [Hypothenemus hampei]|uniref:THAP-type domain-containing protein n=1 Tax=Hypothenemus hampei TaxID=57062 RepID=A0ABD1ECU1_HYPHA
MVNQCFVCRKTAFLHHNLSFHRFPKAENMFKKWLAALGLPPTTKVPLNAYICNEHFTEDQFEIIAGKKILKRPTLPKLNKTSITDFELLIENVEKEQIIYSANTEFHKPKFDKQISTESSSSTSTSTISERTFSIQRSSSATLTASENEELCSNVAIPIDTGPIVRKRRIKTIRYAGDISSNDFSSPIRAKKNYHIMKAKIISQRKTINMLNGNFRRLRIRVKNLQDLIKVLKKKVEMSGNAQACIESSVGPAADEILQRFLKVLLVVVK